MMVAKVILWGVAAFYAYGAVVHVMNMAGLNGFDWLRAPLKWQVLDIVYLVLDLLVAIGLVLGWRVGYLAFFVAALSQILLYTVFRAWIIDVPEEFTRSPEEVAYLNSLVLFHLVTIALVGLAIWLQRPSLPSV